LKADIGKTLENDKKTAEETDKNLTQADTAATDLEKRLKAASNGISEPNKLAALARISKKLGEAKQQKVKLSGESDAEKKGLEGSKAEFTKEISPEK